MKFGNLARVAGIVVLAAGLSGCMDVDMNVEVLSESTARATTKMTMDRAIYEMSQMQDEQDSSGGFCEEEGGEITLREDEVDCLTVVEGDFETVLEQGADSDEPQPTITAIGNGQVRVTFPTAGLKEEITAGTGGEEEEQMMQMMQSMFAGHAIQLSVSGGEIVDTNMERADDGQSASLTVPFEALLAGTVELPDESYAVVQVD